MTSWSTIDCIHGQVLTSVRFFKTAMSNNVTPQVILLQNDLTTQAAMLSQSMTNLCVSPIAGPSYKVASPFKSHLYYPDVEKQKTNIKKMPRERMPFIASGKLCQEYFLNKIKKKEEMERLKRERAAIRQMKKEEKQRAKQDKTRQPKLKRAKKILQLSSESSNSSCEMFDFVVESEGNDEVNEENELLRNNKGPAWLPVKRVVNEHVIFLYEGKHFPGKILRVTKTKATISSMEMYGRLWKWPEKPDVLDYEWKAVLSHINEPTKASRTRNVYSVPELNFLCH